MPGPGASRWTSPPSTPRGRRAHGPRPDALLSIERHATSKIREAADIEQAHTLGFRGEALAAIASVSRFSLTTRPAGALAGTALTVDGGRLVDVGETGCPPGTSIQVRNLFFNVPARRKFLRTEATELAHIRQTFLLYALAHPELGLRLQVDGRPVYELAGGSDRADRLAELYSRDFVRALVPVRGQGPEAEVSGLVGLPRLHRGDRSECLFFVNGRPAAAPTLHAALSAAYAQLIPRGRHPVAVLFVAVDPGAVDVNVHPTKREVRFRRPGPVGDVLREAVRGALGRAPAAVDPPAEEAGRPPPVVEISDLPEPPTFRYPRMPMAPEAAVQGRELFPEDADAGGVGADDEAASGPWTRCRVLGQVGGLYVALETEEGLVLMDPQAAHERVLFEQLLRRSEGAVPSQGLLSPEPVELPPRDAEALRRHLPLVQDMGFGVSDFGGDTFLVDALPACLGPVHPGAVLPDLAGGVEGASGGRKGSRWTREQLARAAARAAVRARSRLRLEEVERLVVDLAGAEMPYTSPEGRPTLVFMSYQELHRKFGRT